MRPSSEGLRVQRPQGVLGVRGNHVGKHRVPRRDYLMGVHEQVRFTRGPLLVKECKAKIREICASIAMFRSFCGSPKAPVKELSWRAGWPESADLLLKLIEDRQTMVTITIT